MTCKWSNFRRRLRAAQGLWTPPLLLALWTGCGLVWSARGQDEPPSPADPVLYTAGDVRTLAAGTDGRLWAATSGGVLCWTPGTAQARRWTTADGLGSNDVRVLAVEGDGVRVTTPLGQDRIGPSGVITHRPPSKCRTERLIADGPQTWAVTPQGLVRQADTHRLPWPSGLTDATAGNVTGLTSSARHVFLATSLGCWGWADGRWHALALPPGSPASHVSALCADSSGLLAALYGDGVYHWSASGGWQRLPDQPAACRFTMALAQTPGALAVGTRAGGVWRAQNGRWRPCATPPTLPCADINCLAAFHGMLWAGSFNGGLVRIANGTVRAITRADGLSSDSPRGLAVFDGALYVRHADGQLDCSPDGVAWHRAFSKADLPRPDVYALAAGDGCLLLGGWAGWSATDGKTWERHDHDPELQGQVITAIAAQGGAVWIGTQKRGLLRYTQGRYTAFQEPQGLTDDWVTCLAVRGDRLLVGTYTGGLLEKSGERFRVCFRPQSFAVRDIAFDPSDGSALAATPLGLYREDTVRWRLVAPQRSGGLETQAVLPAPSGAWVATRAGLAFVPRQDLMASTALP